MVHGAAQFLCGNHAANPHATATVVTTPSMVERMRVGAIRMV
jgi:hypothetical protein